MKLLFEKRLSTSKKSLVIVPIVSFLVSLLLAAIILSLSKANPISTYAAMFMGAFGSWPNFMETLVKAIPLMLTGLGVSIAFRLRFWNIGAEGQLIMGAIGATWVALFLSPFLPGPLVLPVVILVGMICGAVWAGVPAFLKAYLKVDETLTTLMLNYVALLFAEYLFYIPWRDPEGFGFPGTKVFPVESWLPRISGRAHIGIIFAIALAIILWIVLNRTKWGFELKMIGNNQKASRCLGINIPRNIFFAILLSGALSGLAGVGEVAAVSHRLQQGIFVGLGFTAIIVAWMSQLNPIAAIFVAILLAALHVGGDQVQMAMGLPSAMGLVLQGMLLFPMLAGALFSQYRLRIIKTIRPLIKNKMEGIL